MTKMMNVSPLDLINGMTVLYGERIVTVTGPGVPATNWLGQPGFNLPVVLRFPGPKPDKHVTIHTMRETVTVLDHRPSGW